MSDDGTVLSCVMLWGMYMYDDGTVLSCVMLWGMYMSDDGTVLSCVMRGECTCMMMEQCCPVLLCC